MSAERIRIIGVLCLAAVAAVAAGAARAQTPREDFICSSGSTHHVISVYNGEVYDGERRSGACRVDYTKYGETKTLWSSKNDPAFCTAKAAALITKLIQGNFSCKTLGTAPGLPGVEHYPTPSK
jgi:hypothetical protein